MSSAREVFLRYLGEKGLNMTAQRAVIVEAFLSREGHFTAEQLFENVREADGAVGHATVYRTLKLLVESGLADAFDAGDGVILYEHSYGHDHHDHLICSRCGTKVEIVDPEIELRQERLAADNGFVLTRHRMLLYGLCPECRAAGNGSDADAGDADE